MKTATSDLDTVLEATPSTISVVRNEGSLTRRDA